ncbi:MAG: large conductance mechanosensitive channel protein MscL [Aerococcus sp.]|nr:large conductance mechanosensitive channel protein MscL [Aerococcus sp.]
MWNEFKAFIAKGNVIDMAIGVVMGSAFTAIVNSLVKDLITPGIGIILGNIDLSGYKLQVLGATFGVGNFVNAIISFLIIATVLFFIVKSLAVVEKSLAKKEAVEEAAPTPPTKEEVLLTEIRDLLRDQQQNNKP